MKNRMRLVVTALVAAVALANGCASLLPLRNPTLDDDYDNLSTDLDVLPPFQEPVAASGSLWTDAGPGAALVRDTRAFRLNDLVRIRVQESSMGSSEATTDLNRNSSADMGTPTLFGAESPNAAAAGSFNLAKMLSTTSDSKHAGEGKTLRGNKLVGYVTARVLRVLPSGDLVIAGQKTVTVNRDRQVLTLVGSVRPFDIGPTNEVSSNAVGDLNVRLWGRGELDDSVRQGWFMRILHKLWPF